MRRTKNCVFKYRIEACFKWGDGTAVTVYSENREKQTVTFEVSFGIIFSQLHHLSGILGTADILLRPVVDTVTDISVLIRGVRFDLAPR